MLKKEPDKKHIVIVGAGISGLCCAYRLSESNAFKAGLLEITVLEGSERAGGIIETVEAAGCLLESGPDSFITNKPYMLDLSERLGIAGDIVSTQTRNRGAMVVSRGRLVKIPDGFALMAPTKILPFLESPILSWGGKMRALIEPFIAVRDSKKQDETLADFVRRRFGKELLDKIAQPMIGGIYVGDAEKLSAAMTAERFFNLETSAGSVIGGLLSQARRAAMVEPEAADQADRGVRYGLFCSYRKGMSYLVETLQEALESPFNRSLGINFKLNSAVLEINRETNKGDQKHWLVRLANQTIIADQLVLALPAVLSAALLEPTLPVLAAHLKHIEAASSVVVNFVVGRGDINATIDAFGVVVPEVEMVKNNLNVLALSFASNKFEGRSPDEKLVVRAFMGGSKRPVLLNKSDDQLIAMAQADLVKLLGYAKEARPEYVRVCRWPQSMPQFAVGHKRLLQEIALCLQDQPDLQLAGASYRGVGLPECVHSGELCAEKILEMLNERQLVV